MQGKCRSLRSQDLAPKTLRMKPSTAWLHIVKRAELSWLAERLASECNPHVEMRQQAACRLYIMQGSYLQKRKCMEQDRDGSSRRVVAAASNSSCFEAEYTRPETRRRRVQGTLKEAQHSALSKACKWLQGDWPALVTAKSRVRNALNS